MNYGVNVPLTLLQDKRLTSADKLVWMVMRLDEKEKNTKKLDSPTRLAKKTGLSRFTIYRSLSRLTAAGWYTKPNTRIALASLAWANMPAKLLTNHELLPRDKVVYGLLQDPHFHFRYDGIITYLQLSKCVKMCVATVRQAVLALIKARWIYAQQKNQLAPVCYHLDDPMTAYCRDHMIKLHRRFEGKKLIGELICQSMVEILVKPTVINANSRLNILSNPKTEIWLEVDILAAEHRLTIEFQGEQHYEPTSFSSAEEVAKQKVRDAIKAKLLKENGYSFIEVTGNELSIELISNKLRVLAPQVPLRDLSYLKPIVKYLNEQGERYKRSMAWRREKRRREAEEAQRKTQTHHRSTSHYARRPTQRHAQTATR